MYNEIPGKTKHKLPHISCSTFAAAEAKALWRYFPLSFLIIAAVAFVLVCRSHEALSSVKPSFLRNEDDPGKAVSRCRRKDLLAPLAGLLLWLCPPARIYRREQSKWYWALLTRECLFDTWFPRLEFSLRMVTNIKQKWISPTWNQISPKA